MLIRKLAATLGAAGMLVAGVGTTAAATAPASASGRPVVYQATGPAVVRPGTFFISRGVASAWFISSLHWSRWNRSSAAGRGRENASRSHVSIILWRVRTHDGTRYYSRLTVHAPRGFNSGHLRWSWPRHEWV